MIITKKALPRRTFLRGMGATLALPLAGRHGSRHDRAGRDAGQSGAPPGLRLHPDGRAISRSGLRPAEGASPSFRPSLKLAAPVMDQLTVVTNMELKNAYPGTHATSNAAFLSAATAKWTESTDYELGTTVDQIAAQHIGQGHAPAFARAGDGSAHHRRPVRQRLRVRVPEQSLVVVADDAAARRGSPARRVRAPVRRRRQRGGPAAPNCGRTPACSIG